jgi:hypothetical protein
VACAATWRIKVSTSLAVKKSKAQALANCTSSQKIVTALHECDVQPPNLCKCSKAYVFADKIKVHAMWAPAAHSTQRTSHASTDRAVRSSTTKADSPNSELLWRHRYWWMAQQLTAKVTTMMQHPLTWSCSCASPSGVVQLKVDLCLDCAVAQAHHAVAQDHRLILLS